MSTGSLKLLKAALFISVLAISIAPAGCTAAARNTTLSPTAATSQPTAALKNVTPTQANELIKANQGNTKFVILDVRTPVEYAEGHLQNAVNVDYNSPGFKEETGKLDKNITYLVYCRTGVRSAAASKIMLELGFRYIYNMTGGITEWQAAGLPAIK